LSSLSVLVLCLLLADIYPARAVSSTYPAPDGSTASVLTIVGTTDTPLFAEFIAGFQTLHPDVTVEYDEQDSLPMYEQFLAGDMTPKPDLLISSASDLMIKLANDGHAMA